MLIPVPALWSRKIEDPNRQIDRVVESRSYRLMAGLSVDENFKRVTGVLLVAHGHGKYLRNRHSVQVSQEIPQSISTLCQGLARGQNDGIGQFNSAIGDLAEVQALVVEQIKAQAGKYVDRVMAVAVSDPGLWGKDFDGKASYSSFCCAARLAELSGLTVIDAFPSRDLEVGGNGSPIQALPLWLLMADRHARVASHKRAILLTRDKAAYWLPPSDGLDAEVPQIVRLPAKGFGFLKKLLDQIVSLTHDRTDFEKLFCDGVLHQDLAQDLISILRDESTDVGDTDRALYAQAEKYLESSEVAVSNLVRTAIVAVVDEVMSRIEQHGSVNELTIVSPPNLEACLINRMGQTHPGITVESATNLGYSGNHLDALCAAILGFLHVDQLPANVPWLTGADTQRILGRLTPGRPSSWRQLVRSMADFHPPAMKLRDAV